jgi:hypothetical protein
VTERGELPGKSHMHSLRCRPYSSPYTSALLLPYPSALLLPLPLGPTPPPAPRPYSSPYPSALLLPLPLTPTPSLPLGPTPPPLKILLKRKTCPLRGFLSPPYRSRLIPGPQCNLPLLGGEGEEGVMTCWGNFHWKNF